MQSKNEMIGITTTVPSEILFAAGYIPVDLNNIFITDKNPELLVEKAEIHGFPGNSCAWIKGMFSAIINRDIKKVLAPVWGDCSNTHALCEVLRSENIDVIEFAYPYNHTIEKLKQEFDILFKRFDVKLKDVNEWKIKLDKIRKKLKILDNLTIEGKISGEHNHLWLINSSDFYGNPDKFDNDLDFFLNDKTNLKDLLNKKRLGIIGVPPIWNDIYDILEQNNGHVVYNEVQYEFSMIKSINKDFYEQYINYSYPYGMEFRLDEILKQIKDREIKGLIHYTQCFCFRQIEDILVKNRIDIPVLTIEGDKPGNVDARTKMRIENFMDMI